MVKTTIKSTLTANQQPTTNILAGNPFEFTPDEETELSIRAVTSAASANITMFVGNEMVLNNMPIPYIGTSLIDKDHVIDNIVVAGGVRLSIYLSETAGATPTTYVGLEFA